MLTKKNLQEIGSLIDKRVKPIIDKSIKAAFREFYVTIFEPYVARNEDQHEEIVKEVKDVTKRVDLIKDYVKDHDKRIETLETTSVRN